MSQLTSIQGKTKILKIEILILQSESMNSKRVVKFQQKLLILDLDKNIHPQSM
jgi:hypothetical protein